MKGYVTRSEGEWTERMEMLTGDNSYEELYWSLQNALFSNYLPNWIVAGNKKNIGSPKRSLIQWRLRENKI